MTQKSTSVESLHLVSEFEEIRKQMLDDPQRFEVLRNKTLAFWALPSDRRLPLALLGHTLGEVVNTPFVELASTPGIGRKKLGGLILLLRRAAATDPSELPLTGGEPEAGATAEDLDTDTDPSEIDFDAISEVTWSQWRATVVRLGLQDVPLGQVAPTLRNMTRVIWDSHLGEFTEATLEELRNRRTFGEKRVRSVLEVFYFLHRMLQHVPAQSHLAMTLVPQRVERVERWVLGCWQEGRMPSVEEAFAHFIQPLLEQIRIDASRQLVLLAEARLGVNGSPTSVRQLAKNNGLTRARVYQLFNEMADIVRIRWPLGKAYVFLWRSVLLTRASQLVNPPDLSQFFAAIDLFFANRKPVSGMGRQWQDAMATAGNNGPMPFGAGVGLPFDANPMEAMTGRTQDDEDVEVNVGLGEMQ